MYRGTSPSTVWNDGLLVSFGFVDAVEDCSGEISSRTFEFEDDGIRIALVDTGRSSVGNIDIVSQRPRREGWGYSNSIFIKLLYRSGSTEGLSMYT